MPDDVAKSAPDDVIPEAEDVDDEVSLDIPSDRRRVKTEKQDIPVETIVGWIAKRKLDLQPDFQREFVWNKKKASHLIESLLLEIPIPVVYVAEDADGKMPVVDGQQRLTSISSFINGKFPDGETFRLSRLQVLDGLSGKSFDELTTQQQDAILNSTLRIIKIQKDSDPDVKFEVFERLNLGAEKLNDQELRNSMYRGSYNQLLKELVNNETMLKIMRSSHPHKRMADRQLILRFFAMWRKGYSRYKAPFKKFMNREMDEHKTASEGEILEMRNVFEKSIDMAYTVFGDNAFGASIAATIAIWLATGSRTS